MTTATTVDTLVKDAGSVVHERPPMTSSNIFLMNMGFFGIQFSFGLTQTAISPLFVAIGAKPDQLPILNLAGPMTGLIIQPLIGALSDRTWSDRWGRRKPFILGGALLCCIILAIFPFVSILWLGVACFWLLDAGNNTAMEPYRAFISDRLPKNQLARGFLVQSMFTGAGAVLSNFSIFGFQKIIPGTAGNGIPYYDYVCFFLGVVCIAVTVGIAMSRTSELRPPQDELDEIANSKGGPGAIVRDLASAVRTMPVAMHKIGLVFFFQWYAMFIYWQFVSVSVGQTVFNVSPEDKGFEQAGAWTGMLNGTYNLVTMLVALVMLPIVMKLGGRIVHAASLGIGGLCLLGLSQVTSQATSLLPMIGMGIFWASAVGVPYLMVASMVPARRSGVYMGVLNMMIVIPMLIETVTFGWIYKHLLNEDPTHAIILAGALFLIGALAMLWVKPPSNADESDIVPLGAPGASISLYNRVIVGSDGTEASLVGVRRAMQLARDANAKLTIVTAFNPKTTPDPGAVREELWGEEMGRLALKFTVETLNQHRLTSYDTVFVPGDPADALLTAAAGSDRNVIVVGNRGVGSDSGKTLGALPAKVVANATSDVIIVQLDEEKRSRLSRV